jgi:hypothetical protein
MAYFLDAATRPAAGDRDATWVQRWHVGQIDGVLVSEGLSNLVETWAEAKAADQVSQAEIEQESGGTPVTAPAGYQSRSLALLPADRFSKLGIPMAAVVHDVDDGLVPANQAAEARARLSSAGVPVHGYTVISNRSTGCSSTNQTTGTSYVGTNADKYTGTTIVGDNLDPTLCLAGHATETNPATPVMRASFDVLYQLTNGGVGAGESTVDPSVN